MLLMLIMLVALLAISMATAVPYLTTQIKREREIEMIHRGEQYARAIKRYFKRFGRYPTRIEELENTNNIRFLRKRYKDPMSPDGNWRIVNFGQVNFGQGGGLNIASGTQQPQSAESLAGGGRGTAGATSDTASRTTGGTSSDTAGRTTGSSGSVFNSGLSGQTFGGGPMIGVASKSEKQGLHEFGGKKNYKDWLFVYDPMMDRGGLIRGPYNPKAFVGQFNTIGTPAGAKGTGPGTGTSPTTTSPGGAMPNIPGVSGQGGLFGGQGTTQQPQTDKQPR